MRARAALAAFAVAVLASMAPIVAQTPAATGVPAGQQPEPQSGGGYRFRAGVDLVNVTITVTDAAGRFVSGLRREDFVVYEDDQPQAVTHFAAERVPVSLGIALDTSGSMAGDKFEHAQQALDRFLYDLLDPKDEIFLYRFSSMPVLEQGWTTERDRLSQALRRIVPRGGTAMYDTVSDAIPLAMRGQNRKRALVIISDGNDTNSSIPLEDVRQLIRHSEVLVYAVGIDGEAEAPPPTEWQRRPRIRVPFPGGIGGPGRRFPEPPVNRPGVGDPGPGPSQTRPAFRRNDDGVNADALRALTDDSGGRTEIVRSSRDLDPATAGIADELSQQYFLAYPAAAHKDGRWHDIRVELKRGNGSYHVRARRGYVAS
jgi:VWFA-related protein